MSVVAGRQGAERAVGRAEIIDDLLGCRAVEADIAADPFQRVVAAVLEAAFELGSEARYRLRQLLAAGRRLAEPERDRRRLALRVLDTHRAALHAHDAIGGVAELEDVALDALDGEVLVDRADYDILRLEQHLEIGIVGNGAARGDRREPRPAPPAQHTVDFVAMDQRAAPPAPCGEAVGEHAQYRRIGLALQIAVRPGAPDQREQLGLVPVLRVDLGGDLLSDHVEWRHRHDQAVELAAIDAVDQRRAFNEVVIGERKQPALRLTTDAMARAADALEESCDRARRAELADQIDVADIDAELERGGGHHGGECAGFQPLLRVEPLFLGEAAVMRGNAHLAELVRKLARDALGHASCVDENQRGAVLLDKRR